MKSKKKLFIFIVVGALFSATGVLALNGTFGGGASIPEDTMTRGLVGYWNMDEGEGDMAYDASNNSNNGALTNNPTWTKGKKSGALEFDGDDDRVDCGSDDSLDVTDDTMTIEFWKYSFGVPASNSMIVTKNNWTGSSWKGWGFFHFSTGSMLFAAGDDTSFLNMGIASTYNEWQHIVATKSGSTYRLYSNGEEIPTSPYTHSNFANSSTNLRIGRGAYKSINGLIDEVRVYDRALSTEEVRYHYNRGGPVASWNFDEGEGDMAQDTTENNNDGTLFNSPTWVSGKHGSAISFDGSDDYVSLTTPYVFTANNTISLWVNISTMKTYQSLFGTGVWSAYCAYQDVGTIHIETDTPTDNIYLSAGEVFSVNTWNFITIVQDDNKNWSLYVNGVYKDTETSTNSDLTVTKIGYAYSTNGLNGSIDDVKIYDYARTPDEIRLDYNAGYAAHFGPKTQDCSIDPAGCMDKGLVGYWNMDEGAGDTAYDASNNSNNGTLTNNPSWTKGKKSGALEFDGEDDCVNCGNDDSLYSSQGTWEFWYKFGGDYDPYNSLMMMGDMGWNNHLSIDTENANNNLWVHISRGGESYPYGWYGRFPANSAIGDDWKHFVVVQDGVAPKLYMNGQLVYTVYNGNDITLWTDYFQATSKNLSINGNAGGGYANALIDEVRVYDRALSTEEVRYHYNNGSPLASWNFDEGEGDIAHDATENNNDGTLFNSPTWASGKHNSALSFDGTNDYVNCGNAADGDYDAMTVEAWIKRTSDIPTGWKTPLHRNDGTSVGSSVFFIGIETGANYQIVSTIGAGSGAGYMAGATGINSQLNTWYHVVNSWDGTTARVYVDGVEKKQYSLSSAAFSNKSATTRIGASGDGAGYLFKGLIDDVKIYDYARTPDEIRLDYNAGYAAHFGPKTQDCSIDPAGCMDKGLVGYWNMDEGAGDTAYDASNESNNGALINNPSWTKGKKSGALEFHGKNDYVNCGDDDSLHPTSKFTAEAWIYPLDEIVQYPEILGTTSIIRGYEIEFRGDTYPNPTQVRFGVTLGMGDAWKGNNLQEWSPFYPADDILNKWNHVVITFDRPNYKIYLNGVEIKSGTWDYDIVYNSGDVLFIGQGAQSNFRFNGSIDEARVYDRALSTEEVRYHYNRGGPVASWNFDEGEGDTVQDATENNNDGTLFNSPAWVSGKHGSALSFDGTDDYVDAGNDTSLDITDEITIEAWVKPGSSQSDGFPAILQGGPSSWSHRYGLFAQWSSNNTPTFYLYNGSQQIITAPNSLIPNEWQHIVGTWDGSVARCYFNGISGNSRDVSSPITLDINQIKMGYTGAGSTKLNGLIDDVKIYNYARTPAQILLDYNNGLAAHLK